MQDDFISAYLDYVGDTESPNIHHRWCCLSIISALLGRNVYFNFGHKVVYPSIYAMLIGSPGTRKSVAINIGKNMLANTGFRKFSANKTNVQAFLEDLAGDNMLADLEDDMEECNKLFVACDEFNNFMGRDNEDFISVLGELWDCPQYFKYKLRRQNGSVDIMNSYVTILGGNTPRSFRKAFPPDLLDQGFFSRLLLIFARQKPERQKITFPEVPTKDKLDKMSNALLEIAIKCQGEVYITEEARTLLDKIYKTYPGIDDRRFSYYNSRRLEHLLKLSMLVAASRYTTVISKDVVIYANTMLIHAEIYMPKALGEFGRSKISESTNIVADLIESSYVPISVDKIWKEASNDITNLMELRTILDNLKRAEKIIAVNGGFLPVRPVADLGKSAMWDFSLLTEEERN